MNKAQRKISLPWYITYNVCIRYMYTINKTMVKYWQHIVGIKQSTRTPYTIYISYKFSHHILYYKLFIRSSDIISFASAWTNIHVNIHIYFLELCEIYFNTWKHNNYILCAAYTRKSLYSRKSWKIIWQVFKNVSWKLYMSV